MSKPTTDSMLKIWCSHIFSWSANMNYYRYPSFATLFYTSVSAWSWCHSILNDWLNFEVQMIPLASRLSGSSSCFKLFWLFVIVLYLYMWIRTYFKVTLIYRLREYSCRRGRGQPGPARAENHCDRATASDGRPSDRLCQPLTQARRLGGAAPRKSRWTVAHVSQAAVSLWLGDSRWVGTVTVTPSLPGQWVPGVRHKFSLWPGHLKFNFKGYNLSYHSII